MDESGVMLTWTYPDAVGTAFVVERSDEGTTYERIGQVSPAAGIATVEGSRLYTFRDDGRGTVAFYRIRLIRREGEDRLSTPVKVGRNEPTQTPALAILEGSFPNPFNPTTTIRYSLLEPQEVSVSVWDLSGQLVATLQSGFQEAGEYSVPFSADDLPSGTYFVRLQSPEGIQSHPILLMK